MRVSWLSRVLSWVAAALVGGVYGVAGTIAHSVMWGPIPIGLIVAAIACAAILVAVRALTHDRGAAVAAGLGMIGMLVLISGVGPGGSVVVPDSLSGQIWTYVVAGIVLLVVAWPSFSRVPVRTEAPAAQESEARES
ncbi:MULTISPECIES: histidinol dehydrogenase [Microbacterium]|uniref:Histidinol dehydrogenase n=1 Tax=Microbacterium aurugineum TaxID=2851642 RepID=A0ABY4J226_9MICO|nr:MULTISPECIES: histidinol dehydrogenase [Microbacterium]MCK8477013.1 histidinol dehydrogenase [Microbacterium aurugineum]QEA29029.1 histidinol dehydrogenase [Microbacterium sp. CBA3102]UPL18207.1 histidinol dehydrogenase [Microbacterium aurugineum]UUE21846.1 histidinol dehydrogenase [Microbacterium sp. J1-1]